MHTFQSHHSVRCVRLAAWLACARCILVPVSFGMLVWAFVSYDRGLILKALVMAGVSVAVVILQWVVARESHCPLCRARVLGGSECARHRHARKLLGSCRLRVAVSVIALGMFICPYCNEKTAVVVRRGGRHSNGRHDQL